MQNLTNDDLRELVRMCDMHAEMADDDSEEGKAEVKRYRDLEAKLQELLPTPEVPEDTNKDHIKAKLESLSLEQLTEMANDAVNDDAEAMEYDELREFYYESNKFDKAPKEDLVEHLMDRLDSVEDVDTMTLKVN